MAQVSGKVEAVSELFLDGRFFKAGDTLLELEKADYEFAIARALAQEAAVAQRVAEERGRNLQAQRGGTRYGRGERSLSAEAPASCGSSVIGGGAGRRSGSRVVIGSHHGSSAFRWANREQIC